MTALEYASDVSALATAVRPMLVDIPELAPPPGVGAHLLEVHIRSARIRETTAAQQALQMAFDAAVIALLHPEAAERPEVVAELLDNPDVVLTLMWAGSGSLRQVFIVDPLTEDGRANIRYVFLLRFFVLGLIPGGQTFAVAYGVALESILQVARIRERTEGRTLARVKTVDEDALSAAPVSVRIIPPGVSWHPPVPEKPDQHVAEAIAQLRDRVDALELQRQRDRAEIRRLQLKLAKSGDGERGLEP